MLVYAGLHLLHVSVRMSHVEKLLHGLSTLIECISQNDL